MFGGLESVALTEDERARLGACAELLDPVAIDDFSDDRAAELLAEATVLLTHWGCPSLDADVLEDAPHLALVAHAAGTVKDIVTPAVFSRGIVVTSAAAANAVPVAEFTLAAILWANKNVWGARERLRGVPPPANAFARAQRQGNLGKRVGIVGASMVGRTLIELLRPFALDVVVYDPYFTGDEAAHLKVEVVDDLDELCASCDVVSVHAPELPATRHMIGAAQLAAMADGSTLVNTARGSLVDHEALLAEVAPGRIDAVLDVTEPEPLPPDHPLLALPNVVVTPHIAGSEGTELRRLSDAALTEIERFARGEPPMYPVRAEQLGRMA
ncbi:MAG: hydroxyacid dehydrogenase [Acidimicrobiia bacterium]|nr:hydroxyacid dehydrogenase [Acidimicrobiia bacterium]